MLQVSEGEETNVAERMIQERWGYSGLEEHLGRKVGGGGEGERATPFQTPLLNS